MAINDFPELAGLRGTRSEAATTCLVRYFQILKRVKQGMRDRFSAEDQDELATAIRERYSRLPMPSDAHAVVDTIANQVSAGCAATLRALSPVEQIVFLDAAERTAALTKKITKLAGKQPPLML
jgi:hypothetical protein